MNAIIDGMNEIVHRMNERMDRIGVITERTKAWIEGTIYRNKRI